MRSLREDELLARFERLPWLPEDATILIIPYTKWDIIGIAGFGYFLWYLHLGNILEINKESIPHVMGLQKGNHIGPKNQPIKVRFLPGEYKSIKSSIRNTDKLISDLRPETATPLFILTTTFGQKLREEAGLIARGLLRKDLLQELSEWEMRVEWELEIPADKLPILSFRVFRDLTRVALVQIDTWSGTFLINEQPTQKLFGDYADFKEIILSQVDRYLDIATQP